MRLPDFIVQNVEPIMVEWEAFARSIWPNGVDEADIEIAQVRDHAVQILRALVVDMRTAQSALESSEKSQGRGPVGLGHGTVDGIAMVHGAGRTTSGFTLLAVVAEYRALRSSVLRMWRDTHPRPEMVDLNDVNRFNESIDQSVASAIEGFTREAERLRQDLRQSEETFQTLAETMPHLAWAARADGWIYWYNRRWYEYTGSTPDQMLGWGWQSVHDPQVLPEVLERFKSSIASGETFDMTFPLRRADGVFRHFLTRCLPLRNSARTIVRWFGTNTDVTEQQAMEEELRTYRADLERRVEERTLALEQSQRHLRRAERLASMGTLAAGLGHDLANILMPLGMRLDCLKREQVSPSAREDLDRIGAALGYLRTLAAGLRQMAADPSARLPLEGVELNAWWAEARGVVQAVLPHQVHLEADVPHGLPRVRASRAGLTQAIFNLVQNAAEVLASAQAGQIRITAAIAPPDDACCPGGVLLTVADDGPGMSAEVAARCFEPYFSTKGRAVSTGMGLSLVRGVADQAGGTVDVSSTLGKGTVFTLHLPPLARPNEGGLTSSQAGDAALRAVVDVGEPRTAALLVVAMAPLGVKGSPGNGLPPRDADLWITDARPAAQLAAFIRGEGRGEQPDGQTVRTILVLDESGSAVVEAEQNAAALPIVYAGRSLSPGALRDAVQRAVALSRASRKNMP